MSIIEKIREKQELRRKLMREGNLNLTPNEIATMDLSEFAERGIAIEIYSEVLGGNIWFCPDDGMAKEIKKEIPGAICYTVDELKHLLNLNPTPEDIKKLNLVKEEFSNNKIIGSNQNEKRIFGLGSKNVEWVVR